MSSRGDEWIVGPADALRQVRRRPERPTRSTRPPRRGGGGSLWKPILRAFLAVLLVTAAGVGAYLLTREPTLEPIVTAHHRNQAAGYAFDYPKTWTVRDAGTATIVTHPESVALVSFGLGPDGELANASEVLVEEIRENQDEIRAGDPRPHRIAGREAVAVNGTGKNRRGEPIRFLAVTVHAGNRNYSIVMFVAADADPNVVVLPAQTILDTFVIVGAPTAGPTSGS
ncbi:MAG: hypothetical protein WD770_04520 [Actinomycetota bacterium]